MRLSGSGLAEDPRAVCRYSQLQTGVTPIDRGRIPRTALEGGGILPGATLACFLSNQSLLEDEHREWKNSRFGSHNADVGVDNDGVDASGDIQPDRWPQALIFK